MKPKLMYLLGVLFENSFRLLTIFIPMMLLTLLFPKLWTNYASAIIISLITIGGIFYEFKLTDYFKSDEVKL
jgi:hypothetical protein